MSFWYVEYDCWIFISIIARWKRELFEERDFNLSLRWIFVDPAQISELLSKTIADAHARTCLLSTEQIQESFRKPHDLSRLIYYKNMAHEQLWLECAQKLTTVIQQIIEFAKMVPGFMKLSQDDQIVLLKAGKCDLNLVIILWKIETSDSNLKLSSFINQIINNQILWY